MTIRNLWGASMIPGGLYSWCWTARSVQWLRLLAYGCVAEGGVGLC